MGFLAILATNQRWLSEPGVDPHVYGSIELKLSRLLAAEGTQLDASYTCPHAADRCDCRKPRPGLLLRAAGELGVSLPDSYFIGDSLTDAAAGSAAGVTTILISPGPVLDACRRQATYVVNNIERAVEVILNATRTSYS
jgi:D-glycero-D-manno-heptose 1,7-bisphosphate phosphatase